MFQDRYDKLKNAAMLKIVLTDLKNIMRDPSLIIICIAPLLMLALLRFGYPPLLDAWPEANQYIYIILAAFCITGALMPGIAMAFVMLDEKDQHLDAVLRVLPISFERIVWCRMGLIYVFGFLSCILMLGFTGIFTGTFLQMLLLALLVAASAPLLAMIPAFLANNKIEGATYTKALNFMVILPVVAFIFPGNWSWAMAVFPAWWVYFAFQNLAHWPWFVFAIAGGLVYHGLLMVAVQRFFLR
jgi:fluoroquinolone transport system permease protein